MTIHLKMLWKFCNFHIWSKSNRTILFIRNNWQVCDASNQHMISYRPTNVVHMDRHSSSCHVYCDIDRNMVRAPADIHWHLKHSGTPAVNTQVQVVFTPDAQIYKWFPASNIFRGGGGCAMASFGLILLYEYVAPLHGRMENEWVTRLGPPFGLPFVRS